MIHLEENIPLKEIRTKANQILLVPNLVVFGQKGLVLTVRLVNLHIMEKLDRGCLHKRHGKLTTEVQKDLHRTVSQVNTKKRRLDNDSSNVPNTTNHGNQSNPIPQGSPMNQGNLHHNSMNHSNQNLNHQVQLNQGSYSSVQGQGQGQGQGNLTNLDNTGHALNNYTSCEPIDFNLNDPPHIHTPSPPLSPSHNPSISINQRDTTSPSNETNMENQNENQEDMSNLVNQPNMIQTMHGGIVPPLDNTSIQ